MIGCSRGAKCPLASAQAFYRHLLKTSVADNRRPSGYLDLRVRRSDDEGRAQFVPRALRRTLAALRGFPGVSRRTAIQYLEDELWEPVADTTVAHFEVLCLHEVGLG
jgi:hypothetical protein